MQKFILVLALLYGHNAFSFGVGKGTLISTPEGLKKIEDLKSGMKILSFDLENGCIAEGEITLREIDVQQGVKINTTHGTIILGSTERIPLSDNWVLAEDVSPGVEYETQYGLTVKINVVEHIDNVKLYSLEVAPYHNYFANSILVHNFNKGQILKEISEMSKISPETKDLLHDAGVACAKGVWNGKRAVVAGGVTSMATTNPFPVLSMLGYTCVEGIVDEMVPKEEAYEYIDNICKTM